MASSNNETQPAKGARAAEAFSGDEERAEVIADSLSPAGERLISVEITMARFVLAELNTHRMFSRNSASSRAIPTHKQLLRILKTPYVPKEWGQNMTGMSSKETLPPEEAAEAERVWLSARDAAIVHAVRLIGGLGAIQDPELRQRLQAIGAREAGDALAGSKLHKQFVNRLLEPFMHHTVLITATEWSNFFALRINAAAQPEIRRAAELIKAAVDASRPTAVDYGEWHLPYIDEEMKSEFGQEDLKKVSTARAARLSYLNQQQHLEKLAKGDDLATIVAADVGLHDRLIASGHMSPAEHVARPFTPDERRLTDIAVDAVKREAEKLGSPAAGREFCLIRQLGFHGNFRGWHQYRKDLPYEHDFGDATSNRP